MLDLWDCENIECKTDFKREDGENELVKFEVISIMTFSASVS